MRKRLTTVQRRVLVDLLAGNPAPVNAAGYPTRDVRTYECLLDRRLIRFAKPTGFALTATGQEAAKFASAAAALQAARIADAAWAQSKKGGA